MKQIGIAFHAYHDVVRILPTGGWHYDDPRTFQGTTPVLGAGQHWGWGYQILPYIEQQTVYNLTPDAAVSAVPIKTYFCPTRRPPTVVNGYALIDGNDNYTDVAIGRLPVADEAAASAATCSSSLPLTFSVAASRSAWLRSVFSSAASSAAVRRSCASAVCRLRLRCRYWKNWSGSTAFCRNCGIAA